MEMVNSVQVKQNENLVIFISTNEPDRIEKVKVTDQSGELIELTKSGRSRLCYYLSSETKT